MGQTLRGLDNQIGMEEDFPATLFYRLLDALHRMLCQQLQYANVVPNTAGVAMPGLQLLPQLGKAGRQLPLPKNRRMFQSGRPTAQNRQIMFLPEDQVPPRITAGVRGNYRIGPDHINPIDICLDRYFFKGPATRNRVPIGVKTDGLIFVNAGRFGNVRVKRMGRQGQSRRPVLLESFPDRLGFPRHAMLPFPQATLTQIGIELVPIVHLRYRRSPIPLQVIHTLLDTGLFLAAGRHAK